MGTSATNTTSAGRRAPRTLPLRRDDTCVVCGRDLPARTKAQWDEVARTVTCLDCAATGAATPAGERPADDDARLAPVVPIASGPAGGSVPPAHERRRGARDARVRSDHQRLGGVVLNLRDEPATT